MKTVIYSSAVLLVLMQSVYAADTLEEVEVFSDRLFTDTTLVSPTSTISAAELKAINLLTSEDAVAYEPSVVIRRRYVGDPNGVVGIRGSGMFQTARSLVFADGLPLHYLLQTRWSGSPRWSLVGPDEIETAQVIYGPFSAEYSGNAMGGVVNIQTRTPSERRFTLQGSLISQQYDELASDERYNGDKVFVSYEDRIGEFSVFSSYSRLDNESQPMTNYRLDASEAAGLQAIGVSGFIEGVDDESEPVIYIGDSGTEVSVSELYKLKLGYDFGNTQLRASIAYEDRSRDEEQKNNFLVDSAGNTYWGAGNRNFEQRHHRRESLLFGIGVSGMITDDWVYDIYATDFEVRKDEETRTGLSPDDPDFGSRSGRLTAYGDTGWNTLDIKLGTERLFGNDALRLSLGYYHDGYELDIDPKNIDAVTGEPISERTASGGETSTQALFAQWGWAMNEQWDLALGLRYEDWETENSYYGDTPARDRSESGFSPKLSLAYAFNDDLSIRYSVARALRFPITEELYRNEDSTTSIVVADASLEPEDGVHHNLMLERRLADGSIRLNLFFEQVKDTIYNQTGVIDDNGTNVRVTTFLAVDEVETKGVELIYNKRELWGTPLSMRFNASYTDASISKNSPNPAIEGKDMPRVPAWRANLIMAYPLTQSVNLNTSIRYASNSYGDLDNGDTASQVYGAIDQYLFVNARANWAINERTSLSLGVDNLFDQLAYVAHPWPSRTVYLEGRYSF